MEERIVTAAWWRNPRVLNTLMMGSIIALGVLYIGQVNASASKALALRNLEDTNSVSRLESERLQAKIAELRSLHSVMQRQQFLGLVKADSVSFITASSGVVAIR